MTNVGWVGNYTRRTKNFGIAHSVCGEYGYKLNLAGPMNDPTHLPHDEMPDFYRSNDVTLVTSEAEAHPLVVYESLACGVPVVMLKHVGDCYREKLLGVFFLDSLHPEAIHTGIEWTVKNRKDMGRVARKEIEERWRWEHWVPSYGDMFRRVTGKKRKIRLLITVDTPGWAWDIMGKALIDNLMPTGIYEDIRIAYATETLPGELPYKWCDVILNHCWTYYNDRAHLYFPNKKNIPCANGPAYMSKDWDETFKIEAASCAALTSVSRVITDDLKRFNKPVFHCSRGVDVEKFAPKG